MAEINDALEMITRDMISEFIVENFGEDCEALLADGFEAAFCGIGVQFNKAVAVYDYDWCINILMTRDGMTREEAVEYFEFNVVGGYVGEQTPVFMQSFYAEPDEPEAIDETLTVKITSLKHEPFTGPDSGVEAQDNTGSIDVKE